MEKGVNVSFAVVLGKEDGVFREALEIAIIKRYNFYRRSTTGLQTSRSFYRVAFFPRKPLLQQLLFLKTVRLLWTVADLRSISMSNL